MSSEHTLRELPPTWLDLFLYKVDFLWYPPTVPCRCATARKRRDTFRGEICMRLNWLSGCKIGLVSSKVHKMLLKIGNDD